MLPSVANKLTWITLLTQAPGELSRWRCPYLAGGIFFEQKQLLSKSKILSNTQLYFAVQRSRWRQNWLRLLIHNLAMKMFNKYACLGRKRKRQSFSGISFHTTSPQAVKVQIIHQDPFI